MSISYWLKCQKKSQVITVANVSVKFSAPLECVRKSYSLSEVASAWPIETKKSFYSDWSIGTLLHPTSRFPNAILESPAVVTWQRQRVRFSFGISDAEIKKLLEKKRRAGLFSFSGVSTVISQYFYIICIEWNLPWLQWDIFWVAHLRSPPRSRFLF